jgi:hypothetical protein
MFSKEGHQTLVAYQCDQRILALEGSRSLGTDEQTFVSVHGTTNCMWREY